jgi:hypothetical protein
VSLLDMRGAVLDARTKFMPGDHAPGPWPDAWAGSAPLGKRDRSSAAS